MATSPQNRQDRTPRAMDPGALERFIRTQEKEADARIQEAKNEAQQNEANRQIALASIAAQAKDLADNRIQYNKHLIHRYIFVAVCFCILVGFCGFAIKNGGVEMVTDLMKVGGGLISGAIGGYFAGKNVGMTQRSQDDR